MRESKNCKMCGVEFGRKYRQDFASWEKQQYCKKSCYLTLKKKNAKGKTIKYANYTCTNCNKEFKTQIGHLRDKKTTYCLGCSVKIKATSHGLAKSRQYKIWGAILNRCTHKSQVGYKDYGGRGITFDPRWNKFETFWEDMKDTYADNLSIDRIDVNGNYYKGNCRWVTMKEQAQNTRVNVKYMGVCESEASRILKGSHGLISNRIKRLGWSKEQAFLTPKKGHFYYNGTEYTRKTFAKSLGLTTVSVGLRIRRGWSLDRIAQTPQMTNQFG